MKESRKTEGSRAPAHAWEHRYRNGQTGWDRGESSPALQHWLDSGSLEPGRVLVPGCGHGHEIAALVRLGCRVTAVDIAATPVRRLREALAGEGLEADVVQADLLDWEPAGRFDAIYEQTCLCALEPETWALYARRLHDWLEPGGLLLALFMQTGRDGGPPYHCDLVRMHELFPAVRWQWLDPQPQRVAHSNGLHELGYRLRRLP